MIHTVTMNPTLDITYVIDEITCGEPVQALDVIRTPGGKGINVSRALRSMGIESITMALVGGFIGEEFLDLLHGEGLILQIVKIGNFTRTNVIVLGKRDGKELAIRSEGPRVEQAEVDKLYHLIFADSQVPEVLVLSGSLPPGVSDDFYYHLVNEAKSQGSRVVLDTKGEPLRKGVEAAPNLIKPNRVELEELAGKRFTSDEEMIDFSQEILSRGVQMVVVSLGAEGALAVTPAGAWRGTVPRVEDDTVGAGDSMVAGLVMGMIQFASVEMTFHMGLACGVSAVMNRGPGLSNPDIYEKVFQSIKVKKLR